MNLEETIAKLNPFFLKNEFLTIESFKDNVKYESIYCIVTISYDYRDSSISSIITGTTSFSLNQLVETSNSL